MSEEHDSQHVNSQIPQSSQDGDQEGEKCSMQPPGGRETQEKNLDHG